MKKDPCKQPNITFPNVFAKNQQKEEVTLECLVDGTDKVVFRKSVNAKGLIEVWLGGQVVFVRPSMLLLAARLMASEPDKN